MARAKTQWKIKLEPNVVKQVSKEINARIKDAGDSTMVPMAKAKAPVRKKPYTGKKAQKRRPGKIRDTLRFDLFKTKIGGGFHARFPSFFLEKGTKFIQKKPFLAPANRAGKKAIMAKIRNII